MFSDPHHRPIWRRSLSARLFGVITAIELLVASAYVSQLLGWMMIMAACILMGASAGSYGLPGDNVGGLRQHRQ
jgi:predicted permease